MYSISTNQATYSPIFSSFEGFLKLYKLIMILFQSTNNVNLINTKPTLLTENPTLFSSNLILFFFKFSLFFLYCD